MPVSGAGAYSPGGDQMVYSPEARDFRTEKRYSGGNANELYIFNLETHDAKRITQGPRASRDPMWIGRRIYFNSDRDGHFNLYSYDLASGKTDQLTKYNTWDVRWPSSDHERRIVYELDGELQILDLTTGKSIGLSVNVPDDDLDRRPKYISAANLIESAALSPKGERVLFAARGDIFSAPAQKGITRNLTHTPGAHEKWPAWSPDGTKIAYISDVSGEEEIYVIAQDGSSPPERLTENGHAFRYEARWSPDSAHIAFSDKDGRLWAVTLAGHTIQEIARGREGAIRDYEWSPGGSYLAFSMRDSSDLTALYIWSRLDGQTHKITQGLFGENTPAWDPAGDYLYYFATHEFQPQISQVEFNFATNRDTGIFALALRKDVKDPFPPEDDEVSPSTATTKEDKSLDKKPQTPTTDKPIDFDGLDRRVARVPLQAENYSGLCVKKDALVYAVAPSPYYGREAETKATLRIFSFKDRKETTLAEDIQRFDTSFDDSKVLVKQGAVWNIYDLTPTGAASKKPVSTAGLMMERVPVQEWTQIFNEVWRRYRDFFYATNMHGYDWEALRQRYSKLLPYVADRTDLNYVISEMISELTVQHAYIDGGDNPIPPRPHAGLPGARFQADQTSGRYRIQTIFAGDNEEENYRSPLTEIGVNAKVGDYVLSINGEDVTTKQDIYQFLRHAGDAPVQLVLNDKPIVAGARKVTYRPVGAETDLLYYNWVDANRRRVDELSQGRIAYMHLPDMGAAGIREFIKWYYPQLHKEALLIDDRANGGGNISRMVIDRLTRKMLSVTFPRTIETARPYPDGVFIGPKLVLLDNNSASDGDIFPWMFRTAGLGLLVGQRSWGGVVGITNHGMLMDGGTVNVPEFAYADADGHWDVEGHGVDPDIPVENDPKSVIDGHDPQLERGVAELLKQLEKNNPKLPVRRPFPVKLH